MAAQQDLEFLEQMLKDARTYRSLALETRKFQEDFGDEIARVGGSFGIEMHEKIDACNELHVKLLRLNARLQELGQRYYRTVSVRVGHPDVIGQDLDWLHELIGACQLQIEKDKAPLYTRWARRITKAYKGLPEKERITVRWIVIFSFALIPMWLAGINVKEIIKYLIELWRGK